MRNNLIIIFIISILSNLTIAQGREIIASIVELSPQKDIIIDFFTEFSRASGVKIKIKFAPFSRSIQSVINRKADFHYPIIETPAINRKRDFDYSTITIQHINFVLYSNINKKINTNKLNDYKIETERAHTQYFNFKTIPSSCVECSILKVDRGRIDVFIFADLAVDPFIIKNNLKNVRRQFFKKFNVKIVLPKRERGGKIDKLLTNTIQKMRLKGKYQKYFEQLGKPYNNWQPFKQVIE